MADTSRRPRLKQVSTAGNGPLFQQTPAGDSRAPSVVVLSSNFTIGPLFARGALLPDVLEGESLGRPDVSLQLRQSVGAFPRSWVTALVESARNVIPIAIRLSPARQVRRVPIRSTSDSAECVCLSDVDGVFFRTEKERTRFDSLEFSNYDLAASGVSFGVDASLFEGHDDTAASTDLAQATSPASPSADPAEAPREAAPPSTRAMDAVRYSDSLAGLLAFLLIGSPGRRAWMQGVQRLFGKKVKGTATSWPEHIAGAVLGKTGEMSVVDGALLSAAAEALARYPVEGGWPAEQVLSEVTETTKGRIGPLDERAVGEVDRWATRAADVLASKTEPQSLADDGFILQRAVLLLLLRGDLEGLTGGEAALPGTQRPGPLVRGTACALAAIRTGLRAMPARYKKAVDPGSPGHWLGYLGEVFVGLLQASTPGALVPGHLPLPTVTYRRIRTLQGEWIVSVSGKEVTRTPSDVDRGLERLLTMGQHLGFEFQEHADNGLVAAVSQGEGRTRPVYLELLRTDPVSGPIVRFSAPTLKVMGVGPKSRMTRDIAFELLKRNADPGMNCRFAINDDATEVLVLVDQLLGTLDDAEFLQHIKHVAKIAEDFELSRNVGTVTAS